MRSSSIVLVSGGLDSLAALHWTVQESDVMVALTFDYGQRAAVQEIQAAQAICKRYDVPHRVMELPWYKAMRNTALIDTSIVLPELKREDLDNLKVTQKSAKTVWVPNRNGVLIHVTASIAEAMVANWVVVGFNKEEGKTFPDNSADFVEVMNESLIYSTNKSVVVKAPMIAKTKKDIVKWGLENKMDFSNMWSCYRGGETMCGICESCQRAKRAFEEAGADEWIRRLF